MDEETKQRLRERFEQILAAQDRRAETINDIERIALAIGGQVKQAAIEEVGQEAQVGQEVQNPEEDNSAIQTARAAIPTARAAIPTARTAIPIARTATKLSCPHCHKAASSAVCPATASSDCWRALR